MKTITVDNCEKCPFMERDKISYGCRELGFDMTYEAHEDMYTVCPLNNRGFGI